MARRVMKVCDWRERSWYLKRASCKLSFSKVWWKNHQNWWHNKFSKWKSKTSIFVANFIQKVANDFWSHSQLGRQFVLSRRVVSASKTFWGLHQQFTCLFPMSVCNISSSITSNKLATQKFHVSNNHKKQKWW